ncbi:MAG: 3-oxoacyl-[acyl-carrier-protein] synthase III C-terminal domain-containing protein [Acidimicrobiia bacterium]
MIIGTGMAVPDNVVTNDDLTLIMDTTDEWISSRTGVLERRFVDAGVGSAALGAQAGTSALADAGLLPDQIDALVTATMTPDYQAPGNAPLIQHALGLGTVASFDLRQQCSGFLYGLDLADSLIASDRAETVLVVGSEVHGSYFPWGRGFDIVMGRSDEEPTTGERAHNTNHRSWSVLFGDGAGAVVVTRGSSRFEGMLASELRTDGSQFELIQVPGLGFRHRPYVDQQQLAEDLHLPVMDGVGLYRQAVRLLPEVVRSVAARAGFAVEDLDLIVAHQANDRILEGVRRQLAMGEDKIPSNIARYGNTTSGTLPILFHELRQAGRVKPGALVCFTAFGAGAHWGALIYREPLGNV